MFKTRIAVLHPASVAGEWDYTEATAYPGDKYDYLMECAEADNPMEKTTELDGRIHNAFGEVYTDGNGHFEMLQEYIED